MLSVNCDNTQKGTGHSARPAPSSPSLVPYGVRVTGIEITYSTPDAAAVIRDIYRRVANVNRWRAQLGLKPEQVEIIARDIVPALTR